MRPSTFKYLAFILMKILGFLSILILVSVNYCFAQAQAQSAKYYAEQEGNNVSGSPYLFDDFRLATVIDKNGLVYQDLHIKYNLKDQELLFRESDGTVRKFAKDISELKILGVGLFKNGFMNPKYGNLSTLYQVLFEDKLALLRLDARKVEELLLAYNDAHATKQIVSETRYFLVKGNNWLEVKKNKNNVVKLMADKTEDVNAFIVSNHIDLTNEKSLLDVVSYYNSIIK